MDFLFKPVTNIEDARGKFPLVAFCDSIMPEEYQLKILIGVQGILNAIPTGPEYDNATYLESLGVHAAFYVSCKHCNYILSNAILAFVEKRFQKPEPFPVKESKQEEAPLVWKDE